MREHNDGEGDRYREDKSKEHVFPCYLEGFSVKENFPQHDDDGGNHCPPEPDKKASRVEVSQVISVIVVLIFQSFYVFVQGCILFLKMV